MSSLMATGSKRINCTILASLQSKYPQRTPNYVDQSIWLSVDCGSGEKGMVQFDSKTNAMKQVVAYPNGFRQYGHSMRGPCTSPIVVVDGESGKLIEFDTKTKKYGAVVAIRKLG